MIADIPHVKYTEGRFLPYFFLDSFYEGGNPTKEAVENWVQARRAIQRKPVDVEFISFEYIKNNGISSDIQVKIIFIST